MKSKKSKGISIRAPSSPLSPLPRQKGISTIISVVLLLLITIGITWSTYTFLTSATGSITKAGGERIEKTAEILSSCIKIESAGWNKVYVRNCGVKGKISNSSIAVFIDGIKIEHNMNPLEVDVDDVGEISLYGLWKFSLGEHKLKVVSGGVMDEVAVRFKPHPSAVLVYTFDEGTVENNRVKDLSKYGNDGTIRGSVNIVDGKFGNAIELDGCINTDSDRACEEDIDYVYTEIPQIRQTEQLTLAVYFFPYPQDTQTYNNHNDIVRSHCIGNDAVFGISTNSNFNTNKALNFQIYWVSGNNPQWTGTSANTVEINNWNFTLLSLDRTTGNVKAFVNGKKYIDSQYTVTSNKPNGYGLGIGYSCGGEFVGKIDQVMLFPQPLTPDQIYWMEMV